MSYVGFNKLQGELAQRKGVSNPGALAAYIGRRKYGAQKMASAAAKGQSLQGAQRRPVKKHRRRVKRAY